MLAEFFAKVIEILLGWLNGIISLVMSPITNAIDEIAVNFPSIAGYKEFLSACIQTFVPYRALLVCLTILAPVYISNLTLSVVLLVKGFIPTMGGD